MDVNRASVITIENTEASVTEILSYYEFKQHKPWFDEECS